MNIKDVAAPIMLASLIGAGVSGGALGVSGAYFTDEQLGSKSTITAGSLGLSGATTQKVSASGLMPGDSGSKEMIFKVTDGDAWFKLTASTTLDELGGHLHLSYVLYGQTSSASGTPSWSSAAIETREVQSGITSAIPLTPGEYKVIATYSLDPSAGDEYQNKKLEGNFAFDVYQAKNVPVNPYLTPQ